MTYQGIEEDSRLILAAVDELEYYLSSSVILWRLTGSKQPLSPGNLLLARARLGIVDGFPEETGVLLKLDGLIDFHRRAWEIRINKEIPLRLNQYRGFVDDYLEMGTIDAGYRTNIGTRVKLELLLSELKVEPAADRRQLEMLDKRLFSLLNEGEFIWESVLCPGFLKERYGYLYARGK